MKKILIELNQTCNLNCEYCFYRDYGRKKKYLTLEKLLNLGVDKYDIFYLTGGEPFLNKDIKNILKYLNNKNKKVIIFTNGTMLFKNSKEELKEVLGYLNKIIITLDSINFNYNLRLNSEQENIKSSIKQILEISKEKLEVKIGVNKYNLYSLEKTIDYLIEKGVKFLSFNLIHNISSNKKEIQIKSKDELDKFICILEKYKRYFNKKSIDSFEKYLKKDIDSLIKTCICGEKFKFMNCEGKLYFCPANLENEKDRKKCFSEECINLWEMF